MPKIFYSLLFIFFPIALFSYFVHNYLFSTYFSYLELHYSIEVLYKIVFTITLVNILAIAQVNKIWSDKTGFAFMASGIVKMFLIIFLVVRLIFLEESNIYADGLNITIVYFLYLITETIISVKLLKAR